MKQSKPLQVGSLYEEIQISASQVRGFLRALGTDPVVSAHGVEAVGAADKHQVVVSGNQDFDEVVALVLKNTRRHFERQPAGPSPSQGNIRGSHSR